jgi:hypothetical protein
VSEWSVDGGGSWDPDPLDVTGANTGTSSGTSLTLTAAGPTSQADTFAVAAIGKTQSTGFAHTWTGGFAWVGESLGGRLTMATKDPVAVETLSTTETWTAGGFSRGVLAAFRLPAGGGGGDTTPPTVPGNVAAVADTATQVTVSWDASPDDTAVASYRVLRDGSSVGADAVAGLSFVDTTVAPETSYAYTVSAVDAALNRSAESTAANVTTPAAPAGTGEVTRVGTTGGWGPGDGTATPTLPAGTAAGDILVV